MKRIGRLICTLLLATGLVGMPAIAADANGSEQQTWQINLKEAEIGEFITQVARITGNNYVVDPRVKGRITVISSAPLDVEGVEELFHSVLRVHGFAAVPAGDVTKIVQQTLAKQSSSDGDFDPESSGERMITRVLPATNVASSELVKILRPLVPQYSHIASVDEPNVVIISDHAENIRRMEELIREIDVSENEKVEVVALEEAWVENMVELLTQLAPERIGPSATGPNAVQVVANARNNSLVLRGRPSAIADLKSLIRELDQPSSTTGSTRVFRLRYADAEQIATVLASIVGASGGEAGAVPVETTIAPDNSLNAIVVRADPSTMVELGAIIESLDVRRTQVLIEAAIVEVSMDDSLDIGVDFAAVDRDGESAPLVVSPLTQALQTLLGAAVTDGAETTQDLDLIGAAGALTAPSLAVARLSNGVSFAAILQALGTSSESNLLSTPSILTLDNEEASIVVGQEVPFRSGSFTTGSDGANNPFTTINRENVGITLRVIPHIHDGDAVRLEVGQEVSSVVNSTVSTTGFSDIVTNKRTIETTILADDRQTIVLGGLIQDDIIETDSKVPLLGDIPLAGRLFRSDSSKRVKRNLLVFLRPTILRDEESVAEATREKYRSVWEVNPSNAEEDRPAPDIESLYRGRPPEE